jgi:NusA-like KH domain protein
MSKLVYDAETMKYSAIFETLTQVPLKDCFKDGEEIIFVVMPGFIAKAIGKQGINVRKISGAINKNIHIIEFNPDITQFVKNLVRADGVDILEQEGIIIIKCPDTKTKGFVFGREKEKFKKMAGIVTRYFTPKEIRVE